MSKKRKRRPATSRNGQPAASGQRSGRGLRAPAQPTPRAERRTGLFGGMQVASPFPTVRESLFKGLFVVAGTPGLLVAAFAIVFGVWLLVLAGGLELPPAWIVHILAIPPFATIVTTNFDLAIGPLLFGTGIGVLLTTFGALLARALVLGIVAAVMVQVIEEDRVTTAVLARGLRAVPTILAMNIVAFAVVVIGGVLGSLIPAGSLLALLVALYFLGFVTPAAVREVRRPLDIIRRAGRAARLPGSGHILFVTLYFFLWFASLFLLGQGEGITANPGVLTWVWVLVGTFVHLVFLAALVYRWIEVEPEIPDQPVRRRR